MPQPLPRIRRPETSRLMSDPRTYVVNSKSPLMSGDDIKSWQNEIKAEFKKMDLDCPIEADGIWGVGSRNFMATLCYAIGMVPEVVMANGVTPELRTRVRNRQLTAHEQQRYGARVDWRRRLRTRWEVAAVKGVHRIVQKVNADSWGYHPGIHDGLDVVTDRSAQIYAPVKARVIDARAGGWWGLGAKPSSGFPVSAGDGIVQLEVLETVGPFKKGMHIGFGHCENSSVKPGEIVEPGDKIARVGIANSSWHIHLMVNTGNTTRGVGNTDPRPLLDYAQKNG